MQNGKSTDKDQLAASLDTLSMPASSSFDKEKAWDKLYARMQGQQAKPRRWKPVWAAAALLFTAAALYTLLPAVHSTADGIHGSIKRTVFGKTNPSALRSRFAGTANNSPEPVSPVLTTPEKTTVTTVSHQLQHEPDTQLAVHISHLQEPQTSTAVQAETTATATVPQKKLRVVYNNEVTVAIPEDPLPGNSTPVNIPGFRKVYTAPLQAEGPGEKDPESNRKKLFFFNKSPKPKE